MRDSYLFAEVAKYVQR